MSVWTRYYGLSLLIFDEKWLNYASGRKSAPNINSFWVPRVFQCIAVGFLCSKCDNFACLHNTRQNQNEVHLKRWFFFLPKSSSSVGSVSFVRKNKTNYLSYQTWAKCYHSWNKHKLKKKLDGGSYRFRDVSRKWVIYEIMLIIFISLKYSITTCHYTWAIAKQIQ